MTWSDWRSDTRRLARMHKGSLPTPGYPSRSAETILEATYLYQVTPWWQVPADFQYAFRPAGGIPNPNNPSERVHDEAVVGV
jgi:porin